MEKVAELFPMTLAALFLGESVKGVSDKIGTQTDRAGVMQHINRALTMGLVPMILHASFDAALISVSYHKMLAICFCCDCCCTVRHHLRLGSSTFDDTMKLLPGLRVTIGENCIACGKCHAVCPESVPQMHIDESVEAVKILMDRICRRTDVGV